MKRTVSVLALVLATMAAAGGEKPAVSLADDMKAAQGRWKATWSVGGGKTLLGETPAFFAAIAAKGAEIRVEGNRLTNVATGDSVVLANDLDLPKSIQEGVERSVNGQRIVLATLPSGRGLLASYAVRADRFELRYPAGCCSRSGMVVAFERAKE